MNTILSEQMLTLFVILALGALLGSFSWRGVSLGTAGVLFVALVFGHYGLSVPKAVQDLGLLLFVYAVGLQAGPRFFRTFRRLGLRFAAIGLAVALTGALTTLGLSRLVGLPVDLAAGLYTGALTCTPALAAAIDTLSRLSPQAGGTVSVGYGIAYPFSMLGIVLLVQTLPRLLKRDLRKEEETWLAEYQRELPALLVKQYRVTNPNADGKTLLDINPHRLARVNITRIRRGEDVFLASPTTALHLGDVVLAVGPQDELDKIKIVLGEETEVPMDRNTKITTQDLEMISPAFAGKTLADLRVWETFGVVITRIRRQGVEIAPIGSVSLEVGDGLHVVGEKENVQEFVRKVGGDTRQVHETSMLPYLIGLVLGIGVGLIPFRLPGGVEIELGIAGGAFLVSLIFGHFGRIGGLRLYVPAAARNLTRELGLMLFLAGAGTTAGVHLVEVIRSQGWILVLCGAAVTILSAAVGLFLMLRVFKMQTLASLGALTACMTNPPALAAANNQTSTDLATLSYASVYPAALIFKIILAQLLAAALVTWF
ncbi:MAG: aspartate:alanine exchanger family transporter [Anaerolineales bacterium]